METMRRRRLVVVLAAMAGVAVASAFGCNAIFGINDYSVVDDASATDAPLGEGGEAAVSCENYDPASGQCYPCEPKIDPEFLNACTDNQCIPFDDKTRVPRANPDGSLPPVPDLPPPDAGPG